MDTFSALVRIAFKNNFAFRSSAFMGLLGTIFAVIVQIAIWRFVFRDNAAMISYMTKYVVLSKLLGILYMNHISNAIGKKIVSGNFVIDLIKPVNSLVTYWSTSFGTTLANIATRGIPLLIVFSFAFFSIKISLAKMLIFLSVCILDFFFLSILYTLTGYLAFVVIELWPFSRMLGDTISFFSGAIIPIAFFPHWLTCVTKLLPFHLLYSFPIRVLLEDLPAHELATNLLFLGIWCSFFFAVLLVVYRHAIWHSVVQGG